MKASFGFVPDSLLQLLTAITTDDKGYSWILAQA